MGVDVAHVTAVFLSLLDLGVTLLGLSWHGTTVTTQQLIDHFTHVDVFNSCLDLFLLSLIRVGFYGAHFFVGASWRSTLKQTVFYVSLLMYAASPTKLLLLIEKKTEFELFAGDYIVLIWNVLGAIILDASWRLTFSGRPGVNASNGGFRTLQSDDEGEGEEDKPLRPKETFELMLRLFEYCRQEWLWHVSGFTWLFIFSITRIFVPYYTGQVIATVVASKSYEALRQAVYVMTAISFVSAMAGGLRGGSFEYVLARISRAIRRDLFSALVHQDVAFYDAHKTGEIGSRLAADTLAMSDTIALNVNVFLRNVVMLLGAMIFMMTLSWRLSLVTFILVPIIFVASKIFGAYYDALATRTQDAVAVSNDVAEEVISTMRTVRSFACERFEADRYYDRLSDTLRVTRTKACAYAAFLWVTELFQTFIIVAVLWFGGHLVLTNRMRGDLLVSFLLYQMQLGQNLREMGEVWTGLMTSVGASRKVFEYIDRKPKIAKAGRERPEQLTGRIEFRNVHFNYPTRPDVPVLRDLSFTVEPGQTVALVGPSGSGKSSCIGLLERFYQPDRGQVLIDGRPIEAFDHHYIHQKVALVGQEPVLFARSVWENVGYGVSVTREQIVDAAKTANAHDFVMETTKQYETNVGERGSQMSGGQKQRLAIARALVRQPRILLLDEATSALDTESEQQVQEAIYANLGGKSVIMIAHRLSTVEKADKIVVISGGRVEEMGTHKQLLERNGVYAALVERQRIGVEDDRRKRPPPPPPVGSIPVELPVSSSRPVAMSSTAMRSLMSTSFAQSTTSHSP